MRSIKLVFATAAIALACACSTATTGSPQPTTGSPQPTAASTTTSPATSSPTLPKYGAPKVTHPLDPTKWETQPCALIPQSAVASAGLPDVTAGTTPPAADGPACEWHAGNDEGTVGLVFDTAAKFQHLGLSYLYQYRDRYAVFQELDVQGYPGAIVLARDFRSSGGCTVVVGVSDQLYFEVDAELGTNSVHLKDPCTTAQALAGVAITTLKSGG